MAPGGQEPRREGEGLKNRVQDVARAVGKMPRNKRLAVVVMVGLVVFTWLAACIVLVSLFAG